MYISIYMNIIERVFKYEETELSVIKRQDDIWFRGKTIAEILGYSNPLKAIHTHVDSENKKEISELGSNSRGAQNGHPFKNEQRNTIYINESGLFALILRSQLKSARFFKQWVSKDVLPSIRKTGRCSYDDMNQKYNDSLTFKIENETDLHTKVVSFLKKRYPHSIFSVGLGENQDSVYKRIDSFKKGCLRGTPDLIIQNLHKHHTGFSIEFKNANSKGTLSYDQSKMLQQYQNSGFKTLVSNDYDYIIEQSIEYLRDVRIKCSYCARKFISSLSTKNHIKSFHKITERN